MWTEINYQRSSKKSLNPQVTNNFNSLTDRSAPQQSKNNYPISTIENNTPVFLNDWDLDQFG